VVETRKRPAVRTLARRLEGWYASARKPLPWRDEPGPYRVWVGEVMSQQTTLGVVVPRFEAFVAEIPDVGALSRAQDGTLRRLWSGLGYYARARNLRRGAGYIVDERGGRLPATRDGWSAVPGCGPYTSAMIASICGGERTAAVDGNVVRVASRVMALEDSPWHAAGRRAVERWAQDLVEAARSAGDLNQALMELGQEICRKARARCDLCPVAGDCAARERGIVHRLPPPRPRRRAVEVRLAVVVISGGGRVMLARRTEGFLSGTEGFPLVDEDGDGEGILAHLAARGARRIEDAFRHAITHHRIRASVIALDVGRGRAEAGRILARAGGDRPRWVPRGAVEGGLSTSLDAKAWRARLQTR